MVQKIKNSDHATAEPAHQQERILQAFSDKARRSGIRSIVMGELASELRMSATTLYHTFKSKDDIVTVLVERWAADIAKSESANPPSGEFESPAAGLIYWAQSWSHSIARYSPAFWEDIRRDHPQAYRIFRERLGEWKRLGAGRLRPHIRKELNPEMALATLNLILENAPKPELCERLGISRKEAVETAIAIWARGALASPGKVRSLRQSGKSAEKIELRE